MSDLDNSDNEDKLSVMDSDIESDNDSILDDGDDEMKINTLSSNNIISIKGQLGVNNSESNDNLEIIDLDNDGDIDGEEDDIDDIDDIDDMNSEDGNNITNEKNQKVSNILSSNQTPAFNILNTSTNIIPNVFEKNDSDYDSDEDEDDDDEYLQKFDSEIKENYLAQQHPETFIQNYDEIYSLSQVVRNKDNIIIDDLHKTVPILSKYEKTRILGIRAKQLNDGAEPFVKITNEVTDGYIIALKELEEKKIPVIIRRPLPNGGSEYWPLKELEIIG